MKIILLFFLFISFNTLAQAIDCQVITFNIQTKDSLQKVILCQKESIYELGMVSKQNIIKENYFFQWFLNGEKIQAATDHLLKAQTAGYYTLQLTEKTKTNCINNSQNSVGLYFPIPFENDNIDIEYDVQKLGKINLLTRNFQENERLEWYRDGILIAKNDKSIINPNDGIYSTKRYNDKCNTTYESQEILIKDGLSVWVFKNDIGLSNHCEILPILSTSFGKFPTDLEAQYQWLIDGKEIKDSTKNHLIVTQNGNFQVRVFLPKENKTYTSGRFNINKFSNLQSLFINKTEKQCQTEALLKVDDAFVRTYQIEDYRWFIDDKEILNEKLPFLNVSKSGKYNVSVKYFTSKNMPICTYNSFVNFTKKADFNPNISVTYDGHSCGVDSFKISTDFRKDIAYVWFRNGIKFPETGSSYEYFVKDKATYKLEMTLPDGCQRFSNEISLKGCTPDSSKRFYQLNPPKISSDKSLIFENEKAILSFNACNTAAYQWFKDGKVIEKANQNTIEVKEGGNYSIRVEKNNCVAFSDPVKIVVEKILSNSANFSEPEISIFPNPTEKFIFINNLPQNNHTNYLRICTNSGKIIKTLQWNQEKSLKIDIEDFIAGTYILRFESPNKKIYKKFVKY